MSSKPSANAIHRSLSSAILLGSLAVAASPGCGGGENIEIIGVVTDAAGTPLAGVSVSVGSNGSATDDKGAYRIILEGSGADWPSTAGGNPGRMVLRADMDGYAPLLQVLNGKPRVRRYSIPMTMAPLQQWNVLPEGGLAQLQVNGRVVDITVPPNQGGGLMLQAAGFDPRNGPGALMSNGPGGVAALQAAGMFYLEIVDEYGSPVDIGPLTMNMDWGGLEEPPDAEPMQVWRMGADAVWTDPVDPGVVAAGGAPYDDPSADDFGYWNYDRAYRTACVKGKIESSEGECVGSFIRADGPDGISSYDASGIDGDFCVNGAQTWSTTLNIGSYVTNITMPSSPGACWSSDSCHDIGTITVPEDICITQEEWEEEEPGGGGGGGGLYCQASSLPGACPGLVIEMCTNPQEGICYFDVNGTQFNCSNCTAMQSDSCMMDAAQYAAGLC